jgi:ribosomal protein L11 methyltransferase
MRSRVLFNLMHRAVKEPGFKERLLADPLNYIEEYNLDSREIDTLSRFTAGQFDALLGSLLAYKLLPLRIGERMMIVPGNDVFPADSSRIVVRVDQSSTEARLGSQGISDTPGRVFGGGGHPTTTLCLQFLEKYVKPGSRVLDLGAGSGILAIAAAKLGARLTYAYDVDPASVEISSANICLNDVGESVKAQRGSMVEVLAAHSSSSFDLIISNILLSVHKAHLKTGLIDLLPAGGIGILSGLSPADLNTLPAILAEYGCEVIDQDARGSWAAVVFEKSNPHDVF